MRRVALLIETSRAYGRELLDGVRRHMGEGITPWSVFAELRSLRTPLPPWLRDWDGDGILTRSGSPAMAEAVAATGLPAVELRSSRTDHGLPFVGVDNRALAELAAAHFLDRGFRHFGVYGLTTESFFEQRRDRFIEVVADRGFDCATQMQRGRERPREWDRQQSALVEWVRTLPKPCGVMACTDQLGFWLLEACRVAGVGVPDEVAVLGVENDETLAAISTPPLSSVRLPGSRVGRRAAELLDALMNGGSPPPGPILLPPTQIATRQSTDVVAVDDPDLAAALRVIRERATDGISVGDVLSEVAISRRLLERKMRAAIGRTPRQEIERVRLERAKTLLVATDLSLAAIAVRCGYEHPQRLSERFAARFGQPPGAWRRER